MQFLRTNTAVIVTVGPFYDKTDGVTIETGLTITNERITLTADTDDGSAPTNILDNVTGATAATANDLNYITGNDAGLMQLELAAANVNRVGRMRLSITDAANHVPVFEDFFVLPAAIFDWLTGVIVPLPANVTTWLGTAAATPTVAGVPEVDVTHVAGATTDVSALATNVAAILVDTGTTLDDLIDTEVAAIITAIGTPAGASLAADVAAVKVDTAAILVDTGTTLDAALAVVDGNVDSILVDTAEIGAAGAGLTALATQVSVTAIDDLIDTEVAAIKTVVDAILVDTDVIGATGAGLTSLATQASVTAVDDLLDTELPALTAAVQGLMLASGTIGATANDTTHLHLTGLAYADDAINSMLISILDVSTGLYYSRWIEDFVNAGDLATVGTLPFTPEASVDKYWILPVRADVTGGSGLDAAGVRSAIGLAAANLDTQLGAIDDFLDTEVAAILAAVDTEVATIITDVAAVKSDTAAILIDTGTTLDGRIPAALVSGRIDASVGAMASGVLTATAIAADAITDAKVASDVTIASVTGAVGSVTGAVGSVTGAVGSVTGAVGSIATGGIVAASFGAGAIDAAAIATDAITAAKIAADAIGASELAASAVTEIQSGLSTLTAAQVNAEADTALADVGLTTTVTGRVDAAVSTRATPAQVATELGTYDAPTKAEMDTAVAALATAANLSTAQTAITAIKAKTDNLPEGIQKNAALANFEFFMADATDFATAETGLTVTATRSIDGGAFAACANSVTEVGSGIYKITLAAADTNGDFVTLKFTAPGAAATLISFKTEA